MLHITVHGVVILVLIPIVLACESGMFPCGDEDNCLPQELQCNNIADCTNGADEEDCEEKAGFGDDFDRRHNTTISVSYDYRNRHTNVCLLPVFPSECKCGNLTELDCSGRGMTSVPHPISVNVSRLTLLGNNIRTLVNQSLVNFIKLQKLTLDQNGLDEIEVNAFDGLSKLEQLYMSENNLERLLSGVFTPLKNLEWLVLDFNKLATLSGNVFKGLHSLYWLSVQYNEITDADMKTVFDDLPSLAWLELDYNIITTVNVDSFAHDTSMSTLSLRYNKMTKVHPLAFTSLTNLLDLDLSGNQIADISPLQFKNLTKLDRLSLNFNTFNTLPIDVFDDLHNLRTLRLMGVTINNINRRMFQKLIKLKTVYFSSFSYCAYAPHVRNCHPKTDGISSIHNLLENKVLRVSVWTMATLTFVGNISVFISRLLMKAEHRVYSLFIMNLCAADFLMAIYLYSIASQDAKFRDAYNQHAYQWMHSTGCKVSGFLGMVSSEVSVLLLALISIERFLCIVYPYECHRLKVKEAALIIFCIWAIGVIIAWIPMLAEGYFGNFYGSNGVCFPLHIHEPRLQGWEYSVVIFLGINMLALILIVVSYVGMFISIRTTRKDAVQIGFKGDMTYARRFFFIVLTDSLCWIPIMVLKMVTLCNIAIGDELYAWIVIFVLPLNSALNPILYTLSTTTFSQWFTKLLQLRKRVSQNYEPYSPQRTRRTRSNAQINYEIGVDGTEITLSYTNRPSVQTNYSDLLSNVCAEGVCEESVVDPQHNTQHNEPSPSTYFVTCV